MTQRHRPAIVLVMELLKTPPYTPAIAVAGLTKRYGELAAVDDLSFSVRPGAVTGFLSPNGAGETTALRTIVGRARPTAGQTRINDVAAEERALSARVLGVCIELCGADPGRIARDHLRGLVALPRGRVDEVVAIVELEDAVGRRVSKYSIGMRRRVGLAAVRLGAADVLVLDEPLNGLDPQGIRWLRELLRDRVSAGRTVLLESRVLTEAARTVEIGDLERAAPGAVLVRTAVPEREAAARAAGGEGSFDDADADLVVEGLDAARVGEIVHAQGIVSHELAPRRGSLADVFFTATEREAA